MDSNQKAHTILDTALNSTSAYAKAQARKLLAYDTNTPGWWSSVDELREYMNKEVGTLGGTVWEGELMGPNNYMRVPQVVPHKGMLGAFGDGGVKGMSMTGVVLAGAAVFGAAYGLAKYMRVENKQALCVAGVTGGMSALFVYLVARACVNASSSSDSSDTAVAKAIIDAAAKQAGTSV
jgi:hypothetical protein